MLRFAPKQAHIMSLLVTSLFLLSLAPLHSSFLLAPGDTSSEDAPTIQVPLSPADLSPFLRRHVAIATSFVDSEVYESFASTPHAVMARSVTHQPPASPKIYAIKGLLLSLLQRIGMAPSGNMRPNEQLAKDICASTLYKDDPGATTDLVVLGTCKVDLERLGSDLLKAWDERPAYKKFILTHGVHDEHYTGWLNHISEWSPFRVMPISEHVVNYLHNMFSTWTDSKQSLLLYEYIKFDAYSSVSNSTSFQLRPKTYRADVPCSAALQGNYQQGASDYKRIFDDLERLLQEDAKGWGYRWNAQEEKYVADQTAPHPPFVLHLVGRAQITVPTELQDAIVKHTDLDAVLFSELLHSMDLVVPAFSDRGGYFDRQASLTVQTAVMNHVPLLVTPAMLEVYPYLTSEGTILRPFVLSEMEAIGFFRGAKVTVQVAVTEISESDGMPSLRFSNLSAADMSPKLVEDVKWMLDKGWKRSDEGFDRLTRDIREKNENFVGRLLRDF